MKVDKEQLCKCQTDALFYRKNIRITSTTTTTTTIPTTIDTSIMTTTNILTTTTTTSTTTTTIKTTTTTTSIAGKIRLNRIAKLLDIRHCE